MGPQQVLRAAACIALAATSAFAAPERGERIAVIDGGPELVASIRDAGHEPVLADPDLGRDYLLLAAAIADAQTSFGALACTDTITSAQRAIEIGAARQASGLDVPELARAHAYILLCADRAGDTALAVRAATHLRTLGGSPDVPAGVLARYPAIDATSNVEKLQISVEAEVPGADVFVDFQRVGAAPVSIVLPAGPHIIAAGSGKRRGVVTGTVVKKQPVVTVPMPDQSSDTASQLVAALDKTRASIVLVRRGDQVEAWGRAGRAAPVRLIARRERSSTRALVIDAIAELRAGKDRSPDPDQPLLVETPEERRARDAARSSGGDEDDPPTKWWVYATIGGAVLAGALLIYANDTAGNTQRVELNYP